MSFHSYFVRLPREEPQFSGTLAIEGKNLRVDFLRIGAGIHIAFFKVQIALAHRQSLALKRSPAPVEVLFPVLGKYNQRKLKKWADLLAVSGAGGLADLLPEIVHIDKFIEVRELLPFFGLGRSLVVPQLLRLELGKRIKLIDLERLTVTAYSHFRELSDQLQGILQAAYEKREKLLKLADIERRIKLPASSLFFKYLLGTLQPRFDYRVAKGTLIMQKLPLSETEKERIAGITQAVRRGRLDVFAIDQLAKLVPYTFGQLNDTLWSLASAGTIVQLDGRHFIFSEDLLRITNRLKKYKRNQGDLIGIDAFRTLTGYTRKTIIVLFEYFDSQHHTQRQGNKRKILLSV